MISSRFETKSCRFDRGLGLTSVHYVLLSSVALMCLLVGLASDAGAQEPSSRAPIYLGIHADPQLDLTGKGAQEGAIEIRESASDIGIDRTFALHLHYYHWTDLQGALEVGGVFHPDNELLGDINHGRVPVISWRCDDTFFGSDAAIAKGDPGEDAVILQTAQALAQYPGPVILRWYWEFNEYRKSGTENCRGDKSVGVQSQKVFDDFIGAWQHIRTLFRQAHADNVIFLWNPGRYNADGDAADPHPFYPGNSYVDWIGVDIYQGQTETFANDFHLFYHDFTQPQYDLKFLMVGENGALPIDEPTRGEQQWNYLSGFLADVQSNRYPLLRAYCYFERGLKPNQNWVLDGTTADMGGLAAMKILGASPLFAPMLFPVDSTPPVTTAVVSGPLGLNGWYVGPTVVNFNATDDRSGVFQTYFSLDNGATWTAAASVSLRADAIYNVLYRSTDNVGNVETPKSITVDLDHQPPVTIVTTRVRSIGGVPITLEVDLKALDDLSGVAKTEHSLDHGSTWTTGNVFFLCGGTRTIWYRSADVAGNVEKPQSITVISPSCPP